VVVSVFPDHAALTGFGSGDHIIVQFNRVDWPTGDTFALRNAKFMAPVQPTAATNPDIAAGASYISIASTAVLGSLLALSLY
jgi:hypothetical protein